MGCAPSLSADADKRPDKANDRFLSSAPPIPVTIGNGVLRKPPNDQSLIFIFGGPGSQKGLIIEELVARFDFTLINAEEIIFTYLPHKLSHTVEGSQEVQEMVKNDTGALSLDWVLSMVSSRITNNTMKQRYIIDIVPTLHAFLKSESFLRGDQTRSMEDFERKHPVMFALDLNLCSTEEPTQEPDTGGGPEKENGRKQLSSELHAFLKGIDDAEKGRFETNKKARLRRMDLYQKGSSGFLHYFNFTKRVIRLDLYGMHVRNAVQTVCRLLADFGFTYSKEERRVILFSTEDRFEDIDLDFYKMRKVTLSHIYKERNASLESQMAAVSRYVARHPDDEHYAIVLDTVNKTEGKRTKVINFMERKVAHLDDFIKEYKNRVPFIRVPVSLNAITAPRNLIFLFLEPFPVRLAQTISAHLSSNGDKTPSECSTTSPTNGRSRRHPFYPNTSPGQPESTGYGAQPQPNHPAGGGRGERERRRAQIAERAAESEPKLGDARFPLGLRAPFTPASLQLAHAVAGRQSTEKLGEWRDVL